MSKTVTGFRPGSKSWKAFMAKLYGLGAAVVIVGAMFKIQHWPGAGPMLVVGLSTEAVIFFFSAFEPPHEDPDWTLVYPELAGMEDEEHAALEVGDEEEKHEIESVTAELDRMLEEAKIEPELIASLGEGLRSLSDTTTKLGNITDASVATDEYVNNIKNASSKVGELSNNYEKASEALTGLNASTEAGRNYGEQLQEISRKLSELNEVYDKQLGGSQEHLAATSQLYEGIGEMLKNLNDSLEDTKKYKENIAQLSQNLGALNTVYGNMLNAMNFNVPHQAQASQS